MTARSRTLVSYLRVVSLHNIYLLQRRLSRLINVFPCSMGEIQASLDSRVETKHRKKLEQRADLIVRAGDAAIVTLSKTSYAYYLRRQAIVTPFSPSKTVQSRVL